MQREVGSETESECGILVCHFVHVLLSSKSDEKKYPPSTPSHLPCSYILPSAASHLSHYIVAFCIPNVKVFLDR